jgi:hypothetical protein
LSNHDKLPWGKKALPKPAAHATMCVGLLRWKYSRKSLTRKHIEVAPEIQKTSKVLLAQS